MTYTLSAYPKNIALLDHRSITLRPLAPGDDEALLAFFSGVPEPERYFLRDNVIGTDVIERWTRELNYNRALPLIALDGKRIVANGVLLRSRYGAYAEVAELRVVVSPEVRRQGLGTALMKELCDIAADAELDRVTAEFVVGVQDDAIAAAEGMAFIRAATIHELLRDQHGRRHDVAVMVLPLGKWYEWSKF